MSRTLRIRTLARAELKDAVDWYDAQGPGLGDRFTDAVRGVFLEILANPWRYAGEYKDVREGLVDGFPYCIDHRVRPRQIDVISVFHTSRDPNIWQSRA